MLSRISRRALALAAVATVPVVVIGSQGFGPAAAARPVDAGAGSFTAARPAGGPGVAHHDVCAAVPAGFARCHAVQLDLAHPQKRPHPSPSPTPTPTATATPTPTPTPTPSPSSCTFTEDSGISGYQPCDLQTAYSLPSATAGSASEVVAIVDAYDDPNAASDLATYRAQFGLPPVNAGGPTFTKVDQNGGSNYPAGNASWTTEISLDLDMVSAICPNCSILLVEANSNNFDDLAAAADYAGNAAGVVAESNSYGGSEFCGLFGCETSYDSDYDHPGVAVTVSTGDSGYGAQYPATSPYVTAVGGTSLLLNSDGTRASETVWSGAGSGCSAVEAGQTWQSSIANITTFCSGRAVADVAADADPNTGVAVYDTYQESGWLVFGGTSVASPVIASVYALAGNTATTSNGRSGPAYTYGVAYSGSTYNAPASLYDVTSGRNARRCGSDLCTAAAGWDGPTGLGTPNGVSAF